MMFNGVTCVNAVQCPPGTIFNGVTCVEQHEQLPPQPIPSGRGTNPFLIGLGVVAVVGAIIVLSQSSS
jgi:hypothetical protein